jgi:hypothetical protein
MAISLNDLISAREYARDRGLSTRTIQARALAGTLKHEKRIACWFKGGQWWVYRRAEHWPKKRGRKRK